MYNGSKEAKGEANHRKKCQEHRGNEQGKGGDLKGEQQGETRGILRKNELGKWEEKQSEDRNIQSTTTNLLSFYNIVLLGY